MADEFAGGSPGSAIAGEVHFIAGNEWVGSKETFCLRKVPEVIGLAYGMEKTSAARAALVGGYVSGIVTHTSFARTLLAGAT